MSIRTTRGGRQRAFAVGRWGGHQRWPEQPAASAGLRRLRGGPEGSAQRIPEGARRARRCGVEHEPARLAPAVSRQEPVEACACGGKTRPSLGRLN
jgi:hypothetical protein